jgi:hypothetical protein
MSQNIDLVGISGCAVREEILRNDRFLVGLR